MLTKVAGNLVIVPAGCMLSAQLVLVFLVYIIAGGENRWLYQAFRLFRMQAQGSHVHEDAQDKLWEWCRCVSEVEAAAYAILQYLGGLKALSLSR